MFIKFSKSFLLAVLFVSVFSITAYAAKVTICHVPPGNPGNFHDISVSENASQAHLNHGDLEGSCIENCAALCDDADACTQDYDASNQEECVCLASPRPAVNCDDSNPCTADACNSEAGCTYDAAIENCSTCDDGEAGTTVAIGRASQPFPRPKPYVRLSPHTAFTLCIGSQPQYSPEVNSKFTLWEVASMELPSSLADLL
jgi:hypothetical protein